VRYDYFEEQDGVATNPSSEPAIGEVISRRAMLKGMAATGAFSLFGCATASGGAAADGSAPLTFVEVPRTTDDKAHVAPG
jgi:secreted PhoX family phosphatase